MSFWSSKKLELTDIRLSAKKFFVRVSGSVEDKLQAVEAAFGKVEVVLAEGVENEFGFVTEVITEEKYEEASKKVEGVITRIRMED
jgi:homoserine dehydrogenase